MDSFFYSQGSYIYFHIYSLYKVSVIFGHSDMFICLILHIFVNVLVPFFFKKKCLFLIFRFVIWSRLCHSLFFGMVSRGIGFFILSPARGACLSSWYLGSLLFFLRSRGCWSTGTLSFFRLRGCRSSCLGCCSMLPFPLKGE